MTVLKTVKLSLPWPDVRREFRWTDVAQGEAYVRTYLLKHPDLIATGMEFLGIEIVIPDGPELLPNGSPKKNVQADMLYRKGNRYYLVETKETTKLMPGGLKEAEHNAECLDEHLKRNGREADVVPVLVAVDFPMRKPLVGARQSHE